ncbi:CPBP family intramembrane glutamic endopeptidase [Sphaerisporangium sp. NPDC051011]|uniref:CPBP family intramembrane glutamic endopeptidase n=1 Tax=Sphaerisporangium sp. NPDC051011 TaxID=3155792 RepID=UPI00340CB9CD
MSDRIGARRQDAVNRDATEFTAESAPREWTASARSMPRRQQITGIALYCLIAFGLCWLVCLPLWTGPGLSDPALLTICGGIAMFTPALSAILIVRLVERRSWRRGKSQISRPDGHAPERDTVLASLGLRMNGGLVRLLGALAIGMVAPVILLVASQLLAGVLGTFDLDLTLRQAAADLGLPAGTSLPQTWLAFGGKLLTAMVLGGAINLILALGEELGWRGYLMPRIEQLWGLPAAIVAGGVLWGLWHAPLILLGYNYPDAVPWAGQLAMIAACIGVGGFLYWLTIRFGSLWPAALAHGVNNATSALIMTSLLAPGATIDTVNGSAMGRPGWIVYGTVVLVGFALIRHRRRALVTGH